MGVQSQGHRKDSVLGQSLLARSGPYPLSPHRHINSVMRPALTLPPRSQRNFFHVESDAAEAFGEGAFGTGGPFCIIRVDRAF